MAKTKPPRFYGGHYDSVKQGSVRLALEQEGFGWKPILKEKYTARLRLDILLSGNVIITDAQYYDGTFFHLGQSDDDFYTFLNALNESDPIFEVRRRPKGVIDIFQKPFTFSSLPTDEVKKEVVRIMKEVLNRRTNPITTLGEVKAEYGGAFDSQVAKIAFEEVVENISSMDAKTPEWVFRDWNLKIPFSDYINLARKSIPFTYPVTDIPEVNKSIQDILAEMAKEYPNRTKVIVILNDIKSFPGIAENEKASIKINQIWAHVLKLYNRAFAYQHECDVIDIGEELVLGASEEEESQIQRLMELQNNLLENLSVDITQAIAEESWEDFHARIHRNPILPAWVNWRNAVENSRSMPKGIKRTTYLLKRLDPFVEILRQDYGQIKEISKVFENAIATSVGVGALVAGAGTIIGGGSLPDIFVAYGLLIGSLPLSFGFYKTVEGAIGKKPGDILNLIKIGLK